MLYDSRSRFLASACVPYSGHVNWAADILYDIVVEYLKRFLGKLL
jgi:hypothetical protein